MSLTVPAVRVLPRSSLHHLSAPHREGYATARMDGMPPQAPGYLDFGPLRLCGLESFEADYEGFRMHGHDNTEIITLLLDGGFRHRDSVGHEAEVHAGGVQVMSAGRGIEHAEYVIGDSRGVQLWLEPRTRDAEPRVAQRAFGLDERRARWQTVASGRADAPDEALPIDQDAAVRVTLLPAGETRTHTVEPGRRAYVLVAGGAVRVNGTRAEVQERVLADGGGELAITAEADAELVLLDLP